MTKFGFYTDMHLAGETPRHRIDDFPRALLAKQREAYEIFEAEGCEFVAFGGDWFNSHRIFSYDVIADSMDIVCGSPLTTYMVIGEHDLYGHSMDTYKSSTLAFFVRRCGQINVLWEPTKVNKEVVLFGKHEPDKIHDIIALTKDENDINIMLCHELITCNQAPFEMIDTKTLVDTGFDVILSGDLHDGYPVHKVGKTWFANPGSLARRTTADADRFPQVAIVTVEKGCEPQIEYRRLKCGRPGTEVFGESLAEVARDGDINDGTSFTDELLKFEAESTDIHDLVQKVGQSSGIRSDVLEYLKTKRNSPEQRG